MYFHKKKINFFFIFYIPCTHTTASIQVWAIGLTYATLAPVILPMVVIYFVFGWFASKYQFLYVSMPVYESGAKFFPLVFNRILVGLMIYQLMMWGIFGLKKSYIAFVLLPLPFVTALFYWYGRLCQRI